MEKIRRKRRRSRRRRVSGVLLGLILLYSVGLCSHRYRLSSQINIVTRSTLRETWFDLIIGNHGNHADY